MNTYYKQPSLQELEEFTLYMAPDLEHREHIHELTEMLEHIHDYEDEILV